MRGISVYKYPSSDYPSAFDGMAFVRLPDRNGKKLKINRLRIMHPVINGTWNGGISGTWTGDRGKPYSSILTSTREIIRFPDAVVTSIL